jgi:hypothetical protein
MNRYLPDQLPQSVLVVENPKRVMREGVGMNVFLGRGRYYPPSSDTRRWEEIGALLDEARPGFLRIGYLEGTGMEGDVTPWDDQRQAFDPHHDLWRKMAWFDAWCGRHDVHWMLDPWWVPPSLQVAHPEHLAVQQDPSGKQNWRGAPRDPGEYAECYVRPLVRHVVHTLGLTRMRWLGLLNEPVWGAKARDPDNFFVRPGEDQVRVLAAMYAEVHRVLQEEALPVQIVGPGHLCAWQLPLMDFVASDADPSPHLGAWDMHAYFHQPDWMTECAPDFVRTHDFLQHTVRRWVDFAGQQGKPFFITEMGSFYFGRPFWGERDYETAGSHSAAIHDAQFIVRALNEGVDGFLRWVLCADRTVDGRWGLIEWEGAEHVTASPCIFPAYRALMNAIPPRSTVYSVRESRSDGAPGRVHSAVVESANRKRLVLVHDRPGRNADLRIVFPGTWAGKRFERRVVDEMRKGERLPDLVIPDEADPVLDLMITPYSITTLTEILP